jgi:hypothetical protein
MEVRRQGLQVRPVGYGHAVPVRSGHAAAVETGRAVAAACRGKNYEDGGGGSGAAVHFIIF